MQKKIAANEDIVLKVNNPVVVLDSKAVYDGACKIVRYKIACLETTH